MQSYLKLCSICFISILFFLVWFRKDNIWVTDPSGHCQCCLCLQGPPGCWTSPAGRRYLEKKWDCPTFDSLQGWGWIYNLSKTVLYIYSVCKRCFNIFDKYCTSVLSCGVLQCRPWRQVIPCGLISSVETWTCRTLRNSSSGNGVRLVLLFIYCLWWFACRMGGASSALMWSQETYLGHVWVPDVKKHLSPIHVSTSPTVDPDTGSETWFIGRQTGELWEYKMFILRCWWTVFSNDLLCPLFAFFLTLLCVWSCCSCGQAGAFRFLPYELLHYDFKQI